MKRKTNMLHEGDIAYFMHLQNNTAKILREHDRIPKTYICEVEAKARPMVIVHVLRRDRGTQWYEVFPITTKGQKETGELRDELVPIGRAIDPDIESFAEITPQRYPQNLYSGWVVCGEGNREQLDNLLRIYTHKKRHLPKHETTSEEQD